MAEGREEVTALLSLVAEGAEDASERLMRHVYDELHAVAGNKLRDAPAGSTLTPTVLVHEAYGRVLGCDGMPPQNRRHLFFAYARAMWQIVVEHHRRKHVPRSEADVNVMAGLEIPWVDDLLDLDTALTTLRASHARCYEVAILRKSLGFTQQETATLLDVSPATVKRDWAFAKAWLSRQLPHGGRKPNGKSGTNPSAL